MRPVCDPPYAGSTTELWPTKGFDVFTKQMGHMEQKYVKELQPTKGSPMQPIYGPPCAGSAKELWPTRGPMSL